MGFYAYMWLREDGTPYYVGKGSGTRAYDWHRRGMRPPKNHSRILILERASEVEAFATEIELIRNWGRKDLGTGCLRNMTDGGEDPPKGRRKGKKHSEETKRKISHSRRLASTPEVNEKISKAGRGRPCSEMTRTKMSLAHKGKGHPCSQQKKELLRLLWKGKPWSDKRRQAQKVK